ncbi:MAG: DPP IV N-terminal domain-containing protein [Planctomycetota bacterium]
MLARSLPSRLLGVLALALCLGAPALAQDADGTVDKVAWADDGSAVFFTNGGKRFRVDLGSLEKTEIADDDGPTTTTRPLRGWRGEAAPSVGKYRRPSRGRQATEMQSPDGNWKAIHRDWNVVLEGKDGETIPVTTDGNETVHYGTASWVYGEELDQITAMWWTPDSKKLLFYKFDDEGVVPFFLVTGWTDINTKPYPEFYPKAGAVNPKAELMVYDLETKKTVRVDLDGSSDSYTFNVRAAGDGKTMLVNWTDRLQRHLIVYKINLETGKLREVVEEKQDTWQENSPAMRFLPDGERFVWTTERSGAEHYELRNLGGDLLNPITSGDFQCEDIATLDEEANFVGFTAYSCETNPYFLQFHVVGLDGQKQRRVTRQDFHHSGFILSPNRRWLVAQFEAPDTPPSTALYSVTDQRMVVIAQGEAEGAHLAEMFSFPCKGGDFEIFGMLYKPADFDPTKSYPVINELYAGPGSVEFRCNYVSRPAGATARGYLVVKVMSRGTGMRKKDFRAAQYCHMGDVDIQDQADAIRFLRDRPYIDGKRVGIVGHSYGGYMAAMGVLRHPDVYACAVNRAGVTDWRNYDTIYTERYMSTPQLSPEGYDRGSCMKKEYVEAYKKAGAQMLIMHGMVDDNVHPNNAFQLIAALDKADARYESRFFPTAGHGLTRQLMDSQLEFFERVLKPGR